MSSIFIAHSRDLEVTKNNVSQRSLELEYTTHVTEGRGEVRGEGRGEGGS